MLVSLETVGIDVFARLRVMGLAVQLKNHPVLWVGVVFTVTIRGSALAEKKLQSKCASVID